MLRFIGIACVLSLFVASLRSDDRPTTPAEQTKQSELHDGPPVVAATSIPSDKIVAITLRSDPEYGVYLDQPQLARLGGTDFLVGDGIDLGADEWIAGRKVWIPVNDISQMVEFKDLADLKSMFDSIPTGPDA